MKAAAEAVHKRLAEIKKSNAEKEEQERRKVGIFDFIEDLKKKIN